MTNTLKRGVRAGVVALAAACVVVTGGSSALAASSQQADTPKQSVTPVNGDCTKDIAGTSDKAQLTAQGFASVTVQNGEARLGKAKGVAELSNCAKDTGVKVDRIQVVLTWKVTLTKKLSCGQVMAGVLGVDCKVSGKTLVLTKSKTCKNASSCTLNSNKVMMIDPKRARVANVKYSVQAMGKQNGEAWNKLGTDPIGWNA